jgi:hypothetical protein
MTFWLPSARASGELRRTRDGRTDALTWPGLAGSIAACEIWRMVQSSAPAYRKSTASTSVTGRVAISVGATCTRSPTAQRMASFARASKPSTSSVGSASANPSSWARLSASANDEPPDMLVRMKLHVPLRMPVTLTSWSPPMPSRSAPITGMPPATAASKAQMAPPLGGELAERRPVMRDELLVRGDDRSARVEGASHPRAGRIASSHDLHDHVRVGRENVLDVARPDDVAGDPVDAPARGVADEDVGQAHTGGWPLGQDAGHRPAHGAEPEQGHANGGCSHEGDAPKRLMVRERADPVKFMLLTFS